MDASDTSCAEWWRSGTRKRPAFFMRRQIALSLENKSATRTPRQGWQRSGSSVCELVELGWECSRGFENGAQARAPVPLEATLLADTAAVWPPSQKSRRDAGGTKGKAALRYSIWTTGEVALALTLSTRCITLRVMAKMLLPPGASSPMEATGLPLSPPMRICGSISISPRNGTPKS